MKRLSVAVAVDGVTAAGEDGKPGGLHPALGRGDAADRAAGPHGGRLQRRSAATRSRVVNVASPTPATEGVVAANPLMGFDKNDIMRAVELGVLAVVGMLMMLLRRPARC